MGKLIAKTYGDALYELAMEENKIDLFSQEVAALSAVMKENEDLTKLINHPKVIKEEKIQVMKNIFQGKISDELLGFVEIIIVDTIFETYSKSCYTVATITMKGKTFLYSGLKE